MSNKKYTGQYELVDRAGCVCGIFESLKSLMEIIEKYVGRYCYFREDLGDVPGREHYQFDHQLGLTVGCGFTGPRYHVRESETGHIVSLEVLRQIYASVRSRKSRWVIRPLIKGQPVPGTGKWRGGYGSYRHMRTLQILKMSQVIDSDEPPVRAKVMYPPTVWGDVRRWDRHNDNWKRYRKTQYKTKS